ncbi:hypothetical protein ACFCWG_18990 [Streptomyces sp. NPDC056390]|uniref:hypothetical protein n=1 Tax=Streptomyces sp. NPDC056390 TaxID=3345806 RepID=UPI0035DDB31A
MTSSIPSPPPPDAPPPTPDREPQPPDDLQPAPAASHNGPPQPQPVPAALASVDDAARTDYGEHHEENTQDYWAWRVSQRVGTNNGVVIGTLIEQGIRRLRGTTLTPKDITTHLRAYVRATDDDLAINKILTERRVVVLTGADGSGRFSTALDVLHRRLGDSDTIRQIRQVRREPGDPFEAGGLHEPDTGWILDLRAEKPPAGFGADLATDAAQLTQGSLLVVLIGTDAWENCATGATNLSHPLAGPSRDRILDKYLQHAPLTIDRSKWNDAPAIQRGIAALVPAQIAAWADAIVNTEEVERDEGRLTPDLINNDTYFEKLVQQVVKAAEDWRGELLDWHTNQQDSDYRNYLLAAAVLEGARSERIYEASTTLAKALKESPQPRPGQQGLGVVALTRKANADLQPDGTIRFQYHNYAEAVVDYFLDDRPHLLEEFTRWTADQVTGLNRDLAERLAQRVSHWVVHYTARHRRTRLLKSLADQWSTTYPDAACDLLVLAAVDDRSSDLARNAYRRWTSPETAPLSADFTAVLIRACCRLAEAHPVSMLGRIAELASSTHQNGDSKDPQTARVTQAVSEALNTLWDDSQQRAGIHHQLTTWTSDPHGSHRAAAQSTFAHLAQRRTSNGPALLTDPLTDTAWLTGMWRNALPTNGWSTPVAEAFAYWMDSALNHPELQENIEQIVCEAVHRTTDPHYNANRLIAVQNLLYSWAPAPPAPQDADATQLRDRILNRLRAQDPAAPPPADGHARHP